MTRFVPKKVDLILLSFDPQAGHEQSGRRPALVISNDGFNQRVGLAIVCALTNTDRQIPFQLPIPAETGLTGFVMVEQVQSMDSHSVARASSGKCPLLSWMKCCRWCTHASGTPADIPSVSCGEG